MCVCAFQPKRHNFRVQLEIGMFDAANLDPSALGDRLKDIPAGVYFGWVRLGDDPTVYKMVTSVGWNPYYKNKEKTIEPHIVHKFDADFYGTHMKLCICGWLRPEKDFSSLGASMGCCA
jgi:FAD synthase